jgi:hypothetical protein
MPRKKNYKDPGICIETAETQEVLNTHVATPAVGSTRPRTDADIDLRAVLGPDARFPDGSRTIMLSRGLDRGIDDWVFVSVDAITSLLRSGKSPVTCKGYGEGMLRFFDYLTGGCTTAGLTGSKPSTPADLKPLHFTGFIAWLKSLAKLEGWVDTTTRQHYTKAKSVLKQMFELGSIKGDSNRYFKRREFRREPGESRHTSFSDAEQERLAAAIKADLSAVHHGRLIVTMRELQALRLLVVAHRMGYNTTPLLELTRDAMRPGLLPGTILLSTSKHRNRKVTSQVGRAGLKEVSVDGGYATSRSNISGPNHDQSTEPTQDYLPFSYGEGAVIQQAIALTQHLLPMAPAGIKNRVWLFEISKDIGQIRKGDVSSLTPGSLGASIKAIVKRHKLVGDDGKPLKVNMSRFRKSRFDRAFRIADGDVTVTANLMGNTPAVAAVNYPSMNQSRQVEAAVFMNEDYVGLMRNIVTQGSVDSSIPPGEHDYSSNSRNLRVIDIKSSDHVQTNTPVSGCSDVLSGEYAPKNGSPCDRFVMCLFCSSFAIVGTVDELWRLFSFQAFAIAELDFLDEHLGPLRTDDELIEDLRDRYRLAIPYIDSFTEQQFAASRVAQARSKTTAGLHPFWQMQMQLSQRRRNPGLERDGLSADGKGTDPINGTKQPRFDEDGHHDT